MPHLSIRALGPLVITLDSRPITSLAYDKVWALLVYLAHSVEHPHRRTSLAGLLWPDQPETQARTNLRQALARLRKAVEHPDAATPFLRVEHTDIQFDVSSQYTLDATEFAALLATCDTHAHRGADICAACAERLEQALVLYQGPFLDKFYLEDSALFEEWATLVREQLHQRALDALTRLAAYHERHGDYAPALRCCERQLELDPWREEAYRQSMRLYALNGQRSAALRCYERCRTVLENELGVTPAPETTKLYAQIRAATVDGPAHAAPLAPPTKRRHNFPLQSTPFIGRAHELATLADLLANRQCRLITLVGPGGIGKTRLAQQAASHRCTMFADGAAYVSLAPLNTAEHIAPAVAAALDYTFTNHAMPATEVLRYLRQKELLLLLDNFEHLLAPHSAAPDDIRNGDATALLTGVLQQAPNVKVLVTSRERLNLQGEWVFEVEGLETPGAPSYLNTGATKGATNRQTNGEEPAEIQAYSAVALFLQTARRVQQSFEPTPEDLMAIVQICRLVQGMPLALELAACWVRVLSCREIVQEITRSIDFLATTLRDLSARHRSLQAVFDHSWKLLTADEQRVFAACSIFRGGFTREAAAEVAGASLPLLAALVDKSMLRHNANGRYEVHELARQYGAAQLAAAHRVTQVRSRHLVYFMRFAEEAEPQIQGGDQIVQWHEWVEIEHDNLRAALEWSLTDGEFEPGLRIVGALWEFWMNRGYALEGQTHAERFLARPEAAARTILRARATHTAGVCAFYFGRYPAALAWFGETIAIGRELGADGQSMRAWGLIGLGFTRLSMQEYGVAQSVCQEALKLSEALENIYIRADALYQLAIITWHKGDVTGARRYMHESLACFQAAGNSVMRAPVLTRLGTLLGIQGDYGAAEACLWQGVAICDELGDKSRGSSALVQLGYIVMGQGKHQEAEKLLSKALQLTNDTGNLNNRVTALTALGRLAQRQQDYARAHALHLESIPLYLELKLPLLLASALEALACVAVGQGHADAAVRLFATTDKYLAKSNIHLLSIKMAYDFLWQQEHDRLLADVRAQLGEVAFAAAWAAGTAMALEEAVSLIETHLEAQRQI